MDNYRVIISPAAQSDFLGILEFIDTLPPEEASQYYEQFMDEAETLQAAPKNCPFARDPQLRLRGYRTLSAQDYLFFFVMSVNIVEIRRILYAKRQYDRLA